MNKYILELTEEQLHLISNACELSSRLRSGQFENLRDVLLDTIRNNRENARTNFDWNYFNFETNYHFNGLKKLVDLQQNESYGIRESSQVAKELYEIYYLIKHHFAEGINVYRVNEIEQIVARYLDLYCLWNGEAYDIGVGVKQRKR